MDDFRIGRSADCGRPVSYTHLDVYKRQSLSIYISLKQFIIVRTIFTVFLQTSLSLITTITKGIDTKLLVTKNFIINYLSTVDAGVTIGVALDYRTIRIKHRTTEVS